MPRLADEIIDMTAEYFGLQRAVMLSACRLQVVVRPRQLAMTLVREFTHLSLPQIGEVFGRDHTTVMHALAITARRAKECSRMRSDLHELRETAKVLAERRRRRVAAGRRRLVRVDSTYARIRLARRVGPARAVQLFLQRQAARDFVAAPRRRREALPSNPKSVLVYIEGYIAKHGYGPLNIEIARALGMDPGSVNAARRELMHWGYLISTGKPRELTVRRDAA